MNHDRYPSRPDLTDFNMAAPRPSAHQLSMVSPEFGLEFDAAGLVLLRACEHILVDQGASSEVRSETGKRSLFRRRDDDLVSIGPCPRRHGDFSGPRAPSLPVIGPRPQDGATPALFRLKLKTS